LVGCNAEKHIVRIDDKERITEVYNGISDSYYLVFSDKGVFKNADSILFFKFNSSDIQGRLKKGACYEIETRFWRINFLSMYKNIMSVSAELDCVED
jgi:hypothetical protein